MQHNFIMHLLDWNSSVFEAVHVKTTYPVTNWSQGIGNGRRFGDRQRRHETRRFISSIEACAQISLSASTSASWILMISIPMFHHTVGLGGCLNGLIWRILQSAWTFNASRVNSMNRHASRPTN